MSVPLFYKKTRKMDNESIGMQAARGATQIANNAANSVLGMVTAGWNDRRQIRQQKKLNKLDKQMMLYQQQLGLDTWEKTSYAAQVEQMKKAGLNVGLMYGGSGTGGQLAMPSKGGSQAPSGGGEIATAMQMGLLAKMQEAQIANIEADTEKKVVEKDKIAGVDTQEGKQRIFESQSRMSKLAAETSNEVLKSGIMEAEKRIKDTQANYASETTESQIAQMKAATEKLIEETAGQVTQNKVSAETAASIIQTTKLKVVEQSLTNDLLKEKILTQTAMTEETFAKVQKISAEIVRMEAQTEQGARGLDQQDTKIIMEQIANEFNYGDQANIIRWVQTIGGALGDISGMVGKHKQLRQAQQKLNIEEWKAHKD